MEKTTEAGAELVGEMPKTMEVGEELIGILDDVREEVKDAK